MGIAQKIDVEQLLVWAYRDECVGQGGSGLPGEPRGWANPVYGMADLGTRVAGGGASVTYPEDALTVDAAVSRLPATQRRLVLQHAGAGTRPNWKRVPAETFPCDAWGARTAKPKHIFAPNDLKKRRPLGCYLGTAGDSLRTLYVKWREWTWWHEGLAAVDADLRCGRVRLKAWDLADFSLDPYPWESDPETPQWLWVQVVLTGGKKLDTVSERLKSTRNPGC